MTHPWLQPGAPDWPQLQETFLKTYDWACGQIARTARRLEAEGYVFPHVTDGGRWRTWPANIFGGWQGDKWSHGNWTCGFWVGLLWLAWHRTGDPQFRRWAHSFGERVADRTSDENTHDLGFVFYPSFVLGAQLTGDERYKDIAVAGARTLARRYNEQGGYIQAWGPLDHPRARGSTAIDTMMNLPLLWWAAKASGDGRLAQIARSHAEVSCRNYQRPDGSTYHTYSFNPDTGEPIAGGTFQGSGTDSAWSRGIAWGLYGWTLAYKEHGAPAFLAAAEKAARYYLEHLPADGVPPYDFLDSDPNRPLDASSSSIVVGALLELAQVHPEAERRGYYHNVALNLLAALEGCTARGMEDREEGLQLHSCYSRPHNDGVDSSVMWGEWFYLRNLAHLTAGPIWTP